MDKNSLLQYISMIHKYMSGSDGIAIEMQGTSLFSTCSAASKQQVLQSLFSPTDLIYQQEMNTSPKLTHK